MEDEGPFWILELCDRLGLAAGAGVTVTENRPTVEPAAG